MSQLLQFYKSFQQSRVPVVKAAPTFEDLTIDDNLNEQQRVVRYTKSTIGLQRLVHVKKMADVAISIGFTKTVATIIPLIEPLSKDAEPVVKQHLVEQLRYLAKFCVQAGEEKGYRIVLEQILPITACLLEDEKPEVRQSASMTLVEVAQLIRLDDIGQHVLTIILRLAHEDDKEEMRMTASQLLNLLAESLGHDLCKQFVIPEVVSLAEDPVFRVRKSTALNFHNICKVGGEHELLERLMPAFVRLSKDDMYRVRRACAESLSEISKNVSDDVRLGVLVEIFLRLTQDPSKLVKQSILQQSGMFIATLPARAVNDNILNHFCSMISSPTGDVSVDNELKHICAYSFPAVLQIIGRNRWSDVREIYHTLAQSRSANIKQTLAYSLHEVARILGEGALVEEELVPVFEDMIQDVEVVQMGVIKHLAKFLSMLPEPCMVSYLPLLHDILHSTNPFNWRLRRHLAIQLPQLILLPPRQELFRTLFPTVMILLQDPVASVRSETFEGVTALIINLYQLLEEAELTAADPSLSSEEATSEAAAVVLTYRQNVEDVIAAINSFAVGEKYQLRQLWIELCSQLLRDLPRNMFEDNFVEGILALTCDTVSNVRIALSVLLTNWGDNCLPPWENEDKERGTENSEINSNHKINSSETDVSSSNDDDMLVSDGDSNHHNNNNNNNSNKRKSISPWHWLLRRSDIKYCIERLAVDDHDVFLNMSKLQPLYPDIHFQSISCRGKKLPPGGITPIYLDATPVLLNDNENAATATMTTTPQSRVGSLRLSNSISYSFSSSSSDAMVNAEDLLFAVGEENGGTTNNNTNIGSNSSNWNNSSNFSSVARKTPHREDSNNKIRSDSFASPLSSVELMMQQHNITSIGRTRSGSGCNNSTSSPSSSTTTSSSSAGSIDISPIEIDVIAANHRSPSATTAAVSCFGSSSSPSSIMTAMSIIEAAAANNSNVSGNGGFLVGSTIVADEVDLFDDDGQFMMPLEPNEGTGGLLLQYDDDEEEEEGEEEAAAVRAAKNAAAAVENATFLEYNATNKLANDCADSTNDTRTDYNITAKDVMTEQPECTIIPVV